MSSCGFTSTGFTSTGFTICVEVPAPAGGGGRFRRKKPAPPLQTYIYRGFRGRRVVKVQFKFQWSAYIKVRYKAINWRKARIIQVKFITHQNGFAPVLIRTPRIVISTISLRDVPSILESLIPVAIIHRVADIFKVRMPKQDFENTYIPQTEKRTITIATQQLENSLARKYRLHQLKMLAETVTSLV